MADRELEETFGWFLRIMARRREDGRFYYANEALLDFIPAMLLSYGIDPAAGPPQIQLLVGEFAHRAGVQPGASKEQTEAAINQCLEEHPLDPELVFEFGRGAREERVSRSNEELVEAFVKYVDDSERSLEALTSKERPEGTVPSGPFAQFILRDEE